MLTECKRFVSNLVNLTEGNYDECKDMVIQVIESLKISPFYIFKIIILLSKPKFIKYYAYLFDYVYKRYHIPLTKYIFNENLELGKFFIKYYHIGIDIESDNSPSSLDDVDDIYQNDLLKHCIIFDKIEELIKIYKNEENLINDAAHYGSLQCFKFLYLNNSNVSQEVYNESFFSCNLEIINILNQKFSPTNECMINAIKSHHNDVAINLNEMHGISCFWNACESSMNIEIFEYMLQNNGMFFIDVFEANILFAPTLIQILDITEKILSFAKPMQENNDSFIDVNKEDCDGNVPHMASVLSGNYFFITKLVFEKNAVKYQQNKDDEDSLIMACYTNQLEIAKIFIDIYLTDIDYCLESNAIEIAKLIIEKQKYYLINFLPKLIEKGYNDLAKMIIDKLDLLNNAVITYNIGSTYLLIYCAYCNNVEIERYLIEKGANVNIENPDASTALFYAIISNAPEIVKMLIENGAIIRNDDLEIACEIYCPEIVKYLLTSRPSTNVYRMAARYCINWKDQEIARLILDNQNDDIVLSNEIIESIKQLAIKHI